MASDGILKILAGADRKKYNLHMADCQESVTSLHTWSVEIDSIQYLVCLKDHSHVNVAEALEVFSSHNNTVIKEESGTSNTNQSYDQHQALADKRAIWLLLDIARSYITQQMDVHKLVGIVMVATKSLPESLREKSFIR
eukprot:12599063-Ditylum_brightwellii.AAC.1